MWQVGADVLCILKTESVFTLETLVVAYKFTTRCCK